MYTPQTNPETTQSDIDKEIDKWKENFTDGMILRNHYDSEQALEDDWRKYMDQYYELKCLSNNMAYRFYGMKNEEMYYKLKQWFLKHDVVEDKVNNLKFYAPKQTVFTEDQLNDEVDSMDAKANDAAQKTGYYIITGGSKNLAELNDKLYKFRSMGYDKKVKSDTLSLSIYGMKNEEHYNKMMPKLLAKEPVPDTLFDNEITYDGSEVHLETVVPKKSVLEQYDTIRKGIKDANSISEAVVLLDYSRTIEPTTLLEERFKEYLVETINKKVIKEENEDYLGFAPYFLFEEMEDLGVFSGENNCFVPGKDSKPTDWFISYQMRTIGLKPNMVLTGSDWKYKIQNLYKGELTTDEDKQKMLELGWNPAIEPTENAFYKASERANKVLRENLGYRFIDLTEEVQSMPNDEINPDIHKTPFLGGLFIIFTSDEFMENLPSDIPPILATTDPDLERMHPLNYGLFNTPISIQDLRNMAKGHRLHLDIYYLHFSPELHNKLVEVLDFFTIHGNDFRFRHSITVGVIGRYKQLFIANKKLFCANLYNLILYAMEYGYQDPGAYLSMPMLSNMVGYDNKKNVYKMYGGPIDQYRPEQIKNIITHNYTYGLFDEDARFEYLRPYVQVIPVTEIATLPIDLDKDGNLLVRRRMQLDFAEEYSKCHKLLMQYSKAKGYEQMKYYVAKLWYMNILIEKRLHSPKKYDKATLTKYYNTRAHIISDFKQYMNEILQNDPNFNFQEYYHKTPFDRSTLKISKRLMDAVWKFFKALTFPFRK